MKRNEITALLRMQRKSIEEKAKAATIQKRRKLDRIVNKRKQAYLKRIEKQITDAAKDGKDSIVFRYDLEFESVCWFWERIFLGSLETSLELEFRNSLKILLGEHLSEFSTWFHQYTATVEISWPE